MGCSYLDKIWHSLFAYWFFPTVLKISLYRNFISAHFLEISLLWRVVRPSNSSLSPASKQNLAQKYARLMSRLNWNYFFIYNYAKMEEVLVNFRNSWGSGFVARFEFLIINLTSFTRNLIPSFTYFTTKNYSWCIFSKDIIKKQFLFILYENYLNVVVM